MKPCADKPCNDCPMRRKSAAGWLGAATPEQFIQTVHSEAAMPCHQTVNYEDPAWELQVMPGGNAQHCAGVAIYFANTCKRPRDDRRQLKADKVNVFSNPVEFVEHHRSSGVVSGTTEPEFDPTFNMVKLKELVTQRSQVKKNVKRKRA